MRQNTEIVSPMSNEGRNQYVVEHITEALLSLMKTKHIHKITIEELCKAAGVGRASFYRNFDSKEAVISRELKRRLETWWLSAITKPDFNFAKDLFTYYYGQRELCILLYHQGLAYLSLQSIKEACGPKPEQENFEAYTSAFLAYGLYGWIEEWFLRGMQETPEEIAQRWEQAKEKEASERNKTQ